MQGIEEVEFIELIKSDPEVSVNWTACGRKHLGPPYLRVARDGPPVLFAFINGCPDPELVQRGYWHISIWPVEKCIVDLSYNKGKLVKLKTRKCVCDRFANHEHSIRFGPTVREEPETLIFDPPIDLADYDRVVWIIQNDNRQAKGYLLPDKNRIRIEYCMMPTLAILNHPDIHIYVADGPAKGSCIFTKNGFLSAFGHFDM